jgi:hypothetical protein
MGGTCRALVGHGGACDGNSQCQSGLCTGGRCCNQDERACGTACVLPSQPCDGSCPQGRILCNGGCVPGDCCDSAACGRCKKCVSNRCQNQGSNEDLKNDCYEGPCDTGNCDGSGSCGHLARGTVYCEVTRLITCSGGESFTDMQCPNNCQPSCKPTSSSCKGPATCNECQPGLGFRHCASSTSTAECNSNGRWGTPMPCPAGEVCKGNEFTASCSPP